MAKYETVTAEGKEFSDWIFPRLPTEYKMACCDCGLVHDMQFVVMRVKERLSGNRMDLIKIRKQDKFQIGFRARRNARSTGQKRRIRKKN